METMPNSIDKQIELAGAAAASQAKNTRRNIKYAEQNFTKFLQSSKENEECSTLLRGLHNERGSRQRDENGDCGENDPTGSNGGATVAVTDSPTTLFSYLLANKRSEDCVAILQEYCLWRCKSIGPATLDTELRCLKGFVSELEIPQTDENHLKQIWGHPNLKNTKKTIRLLKSTRGTDHVNAADFHDEQNVGNTLVALRTRLVQGETNESTTSPDEPGSNYCVPFTHTQTIQIAHHLFETGDIMMLALTNMLRVLGCRPSSLKTMVFRNGLGIFDETKHMWRVRTEYSKTRNMPDELAVFMDMTDPILCPITSMALALSQVNPFLEIEGDDHVFGVLWDSIRKRRIIGEKALPSDTALLQRFRLVTDALFTNEPYTKNLSLYSFRKYMVTHLVNSFHSNEMHAKARAGWIQFQRQASAANTGGTTANAWVNSNDISSHYIGLENAGDERMALILSNRHPDAPYENYILKWAERNCPKKVLNGVKTQAFPSNIRSCFLESGKKTSKFLNAMALSLLIAKAKVPAKSLNRFEAHLDLFSRHCFCNETALMFLDALAEIPLYPQAEPNSTFRSYLETGRMMRYHVDETTGDLGSVHYIMKTETFLRAFHPKPDPSEDIVVLADTMDELVVNDDPPLFMDEIEGELETDESVEKDCGETAQDEDDEDATMEEEDCDSFFLRSIGYDGASGTITISNEADKFMQQLLQVMKPNGRPLLPVALRDMFKQWEEPMINHVPPMKDWDPAAINALKTASRKDENKRWRRGVIGSRLHYAYTSRRDTIELCLKHFGSLENAIETLVKNNVNQISKIKDYCKTL